MNDDNRIAKIDILIQQGKYSDAEKILKDLLSVDASNIFLLSLFAEVNLRQDKLDIATKTIDNAIGLAPDSAHLYYVKSRIAFNNSDLAEAERCCNQCISLDPYDADYFALLAHLKLFQKKFEIALEEANRALEIDPENLLALNTRSTVLIKLDKSEESFQTIEGALRNDPNNAYTHANYGWNLLEKGNHKKALDHFKESLKNDPSFDYAKAGMMEALKASNPIYRLFLKYSFWMSNMTSKYQWYVIIGFYVGFRILRSLAKNNESWQPFLNPLLVLLALIAFSTWVINPIGNLFLRFNPYGKLLLDKKEILSSNFVAVSFLTSILGVLSYFILGNEAFLAMAVFGFAMMLPCSVMFSPSKFKNGLLIYTIALAIIGFLALGLSFASSQMINTFSTFFVIGFFAFQWVANYLVISDGK
uniref:tetratricopeptide repeat protein n=1 Tax=Flavobacterium sp. TaxID=239 RepID=UPI004049CFDD